ncbi:hypothetical protein O181_052658 [Austropuccinia psidii MF-1]|uniref:Uncharacterized protein n=1 Tax=Austropuccinia psidii MF-1 TaxID=1389203 RepID=A0A9Q3E321_9BASI|nr:hypothetical protein [Austropuccinia psidii MF-1]
MNQFQRDITHQSPSKRPPEEYGQDLGHLRHHWNSVVAQGSNMSDWSNGYLEVSVLGLSQPPFSNQCNHSVSALELSQSVENIHLTPSISLSGVSLATTEASGGGSEKKNKRRKKAKRRLLEIANQTLLLRITMISVVTLNRKKIMITSLLLRSVFITVHNGLVHIKKYLTAQLWVNNTGVGLTETDLGTTMEQKLESMCPFYNCMDNIFGKKANVEALDERDSTKSMAVMSEGEGETDIETSSNSDSGLSAYELQQRSAKRKLGIPRKANVEDIPTSITPVSDTKSCIDKNCGVTDPKSHSGVA